MYERITNSSDIPANSADSIRMFGGLRGKVNVFVPKDTNLESDGTNVQTLFLSDKSQDLYIDLYLSPNMLVVDANSIQIVDAISTNSDTKLATTGKDIIELNIIFYSDDENNDGASITTTLDDLNLSVTAIGANDDAIKFFIFNNSGELIEYTNSNFSVNAVEGEANVSSIDTSIIAATQFLDASKILNMLFIENLGMHKEAGSKSFTLYGKLGSIHGEATHDSSSTLICDDCAGSFNNQDVRLSTSSDLQVDGINLIVGLDYSHLMMNVKDMKGSYHYDGLNMGLAFGYSVGSYAKATQVGFHATYTNNPIYINAYAGFSDEEFLDIKYLSHQANVTSRSIFSNLEAGYMLVMPSANIKLNTYAGVDYNIFTLDETDFSSVVMHEEDAHYLGFEGGFKLSTIHNIGFQNFGLLPYIDVKINYNMTPNNFKTTLTNSHSNEYILDQGKEASQLYYIVASGFDIDFDSTMLFSFGIRYQQSDNVNGYGMNAGLKFKV